MPSSWMHVAHGRCCAAAAIAQRKTAADAEAAAAHGVNGIAGPSGGGDVEMAVANGSSSPAHAANGSASRCEWPRVGCMLDDWSW